MKKFNINTSINEFFLFHGTKADIIQKITLEGFDLKFSRGGLFGRGIYFGENSSKSDEYCIADKNGTFYMLLVRVILGRNTLFLNAFQDRNHDDPCLLSNNNIDHNCSTSGTNCSDNKADSLISPTTKTHPNAYLKKYREFVVYDDDQIYPEFLIEYTRV